MFPKFEVTRLEGETIPTYLGKWNGRPLTIRLDNSAVMKLEGGEPANDDRALPDGSQNRVALAAHRLLTMRQGDHQNDAFTVVMTALDLE